VTTSATTAVEAAAAAVAAAAPAPDPEVLRRNLDALLPLVNAARRVAAEDRGAAV
jgi:hypothetical protein